MVQCHVDTLESDMRRQERGFCDRFRCSDEGQHRAVMVFIALLVQQHDAGDRSHRGSQCLDGLHVPAFAEIRDTLYDPIHQDPRLWLHWEFIAFIARSRCPALPSHSSFQYTNVPYRD